MVINVTFRNDNSKTTLDIDLTTVTNGTLFDPAAFGDVLQKVLSSHVEGTNLGGYDVQEEDSIDIGASEKGSIDLLIIIIAYK